MGIRWGIDLGGTKIEGIVFREEDSVVLARLRVPTESWKGYDHILRQISELIQMLEKASQTTSDIIGMCTPGTLDPIIGVMKNSNTTCLNGKNLPADLQQLTGIEFRTSNDANCFAIAEANMGVVPRLMPEARVVFGAIMGTGCGGGLVVDGKIIGGRQGIGGEWGHNFLHESGGPCYCGKTGCVEMVISGPALEKYYAQQSGNQCDMAEITRRYREGSDEVAAQTMERLFHFFGQAISVVINIADPDAIVIGGGLGNIDELYTMGVAQIQQHIFNHRLDTRFFKPMLGDSAGVYGAAFLY